MSKNRVAFIEESSLKRIATLFLTEYNPDGTIPVDIEDIAEVQLGLMVIPIRGLRSNHGPESHIAINVKKIIVDAHSWEGEVNRYRFTLAHEVGHFVLHGKYINSDKVDCIESYLAFQNSITADEEKRLEIQANCLAGYILMPVASFRKATDKQISDHGGAEVMTVSDLEEIIGELAENFQVSRDAVFNQFHREYKELYDKMTLLA